MRRAIQMHAGECRNAVFGNGGPDSIVYINVLEHVEDDQTELRMAHSVLASGGRLLVFVPAHEWLMSRFDRKLGHFRRYTRESLT